LKAGRRMLFNRAAVIEALARLAAVSNGEVAARA
jgi:hypothetical protein